MSIEAMKQALEALENVTDVFLDSEGNHGHVERDAIDKAYNSITSLRQAIATKESSATQEPVAWMQESIELYVKDEKDEKRGYVIPLYTHPQPKADPTSGNWYAAEDIDRMVRELDVVMNGKNAASQSMLCDLMPQLREKLSQPKAEPKRESLTDEQITNFWLARFDVEGYPIINFARAIEAAHGIKGEA